MIIEVFKTNISHPRAVHTAISSLLRVWPDWKINIDLHDCDNILRIESLSEVDVTWVSSHLSGIGYMAEVLE
ncbi:MAG: hypothetical protein QM687_00200 [Ferruginibacter sp.]